MTFKQIAVRLPRLLDKNLNEVGRLQPKAQSIELNIAPLSTASLTLEDGSGIAIRSFVELYNAKGSVGVFRVSMPDESFGSGERISLEHGICTLDDAIVHGTGEIIGSPAYVLEQILSYQTTKARGQNMWRVGTVEAPDDMTITVEHDGTKTLEMLARTMQALEGYMITFDQGVFPWVLNVIKKPDTVACEGRLSRNIRTIRKTMDDSDLCTRLYCSRLDGGYIESDTIGVWGEVEQSITLNDDMSEDDANAYCRRYLDNRKNPVLAVQMDASEWFTLTGERLDRFEIGDICRIALPEYGVVLEERIVALSYANALGAPELATVSLANQIEDLSIKTAKTEQDVSDLKNTSTHYGNRISTSETNITNLKDTAEGIEEINGKMTHWFNSVEIDLNAEEAQLGLIASRSEVTANTEKINTAMIILDGDTESGGSQIGLIAKVEENTRDLDDQNDRISSAELILIGDPGSATAGLVARVDDNTAAIEVHADELESRVTIEALEIELKGYVTATQLDTEFTELQSGIAKSLYVKALSASGFECSSFKLDGYELTLGSMKVCVGGSVSKSTTSEGYDVLDGGVVVGKCYVPNWTFEPSKDTLYYLSWE